jgi:two-component system chemotaxis sensor kinase CheA
MSIENDETLRMYVEESQEHLADIENDLLAIEQRGADLDEELVNKVFRAAHSIKGGAGFMGLVTIKELSHKMENVLGMIRSKEMVPNPEVINILLLASDALKKLLDNVLGSNDIDVSEHIKALVALAEGALPDEGKKSISKAVDVSFPNGTVAFNVAEFDIANGRQGGKFIYLVDLDLIHDVHQKNRTPLDVLRELEKTGLILDSKMNITGVGTLEDGGLTNRLPFLVLYATLLDPTLINTLFEIDEDRIFELTKDMVTRPIGEYCIPESTGPETAEGEVTAPKTSFQDREQRTALQRNQPAQAAGNDEPEATEPGAVEAEPEAIEEEPVAEDVGRSCAADQGSQKEIPKKVAEMETSLRVNVSLLDSLMNLAGELVLSRNQLLQAIGSNDMRTIQLGGQRLDLITSELQEAIMLTRMQPIGNVFNKFQRVVRDLARNLGKEVDLFIEGSEVELDKTIIEAISDPLTHLVRNSADHGIETPDQRLKAGKRPGGRIDLRAFHDAGQVNIEIVDDGKGIHGNKLVASALAKGLITEDQARTMSDKEKINLIFLPGFSTAEKVTDVSGRGVGMDVVKTNLDKLGGVVDVESEPGKGTRVRIKLPLTLAIIPSQIITTGGDRYAIPQVNMDELLRIPASQIHERIEKVGGAEVVRLRGQLLPLLKLNEILGVESSYIDPGDGGQKSSRRKSIVDERAPRDGSSNDRRTREACADPIAESEKETPTFVEVAAGQARKTAADNGRKNPERRYHSESAVKVVVVSAGALKYGLVVDRLHDSEEIVVKPLGRHLKRCKGYAGATIMGDGRVALILDVGSLVHMAGLHAMDSAENTAAAAKDVADAISAKKDMQSLLVFRSAEDEQFAVTLSQVERIEKIKATDVELLGGKRVMQYRGGSLPLFSIDEAAQVKPLAEKEDLLVIVFVIGGREIGLLAMGPVDAVEVATEVDGVTLKQPGIMGSSIVAGRTTQFVDIYAMVETLHPEWFEKRETADAGQGEAVTVLIVEDSTFFRNQVKGFMEEAGYNVIPAEDGVEAWSLLEEHRDEVDIIVTDIEMPNMNGFELTKKIKNDDRFAHLPVIALTTLAGEADVARGKEVGIDDYQIKLDREKLMDSVNMHARG